MSAVHKINVSIPVIFIEENDQITAYTSVLDLATCGKDIDQAKKRFEEILTIFFEGLCKKGTLEDVLLECGWKKVRKEPLSWEPPWIVGTITEQFTIPCHT